MTVEEALNAIENDEAFDGRGYNEKVCVLIVETLADKKLKEEKEGKWIPADDAIIAGHCSACGWAAIYDETDVFGMPFCPNCGSKLETDK